MFEVFLGTNGLEKSYQGEFPETTECVHCKGEARIGFVVFEKLTEESSTPICHVCNIHDNDPDGEGYWLHDFCAVAVYFCKKCLEPTALYNQA